MAAVWKDVVDLLELKRQMPSSRVHCQSARGARCTVQLQLQQPHGRPVTVIWHCILTPLNAVDQRTLLTAARNRVCVSV